MTEFDKNKYSEYEELLKSMSPDLLNDEPVAAEPAKPYVAETAKPYVAEPAKSYVTETAKPYVAEPAKPPVAKPPVAEEAPSSARLDDFTTAAHSPEAEEPSVSLFGEPVVQEASDPEPAAAATTKTFNKKPNRVTGVFEWMESAVFAVVVVILLFTFVFRIVGIDGESMVPTLQNKDRVIITNLFFTPQTGDIVVLDMGSNDVVLNGRPYSKPLIKRVIATGGQTVEVINEAGEQNVYVDGVKLGEDYINFATVMKSSSQSKLTVPEGQVFVMGDNRGESLDSRAFGCVDARSIVGHAIFRIYPMTEIGLLNS